MKTRLTLIIFTMVFVNVILISCKDDPLKGYVTFEKSEVFSLDSKKKKKIDVKILDDSIKSENKLKISNNDLFDFNPFAEYLDKDFFKAIASKYYLNEIPGHIFKKISNNEYRKISLKRFVKNNSYPQIKIVEKEYYNDRVTDRKQINATAQILNVGISKEQILELLIKDESTIYLTDSLIDDVKLKEFIKRFDPSEIGDYYFAQGATISSVTNRLYSKQRFTTRVDLSYITASGETYSSKDNFKTRMDVSLELISLKDY